MLVHARRASDTATKRQGEESPRASFTEFVMVATVAVTVALVALNAVGGRSSDTEEDEQTGNS